MEMGLLQLGAVTISLLFLLAFPFIPISVYLFRGERWPTILLTSVVIGCSLQAVLGLLWSHLVGKWAYGELAVLAMIWLLSLWWGFRRYKLSVDEFDIDSKQEQSCLGLILVLAAAFLVRSIHPLEVSYLGQSDAYTHLHYLHNIVAKGHLDNPVYPSGYHWILALPVLVFSLDPYWVARFAGAFFGTCLVLGIYVFLEQAFNRRTALLGSFCAACFPPMNLLLKTGVGVFANQFGLFLLPAIFLFYLLVVYKGKRSAGATVGLLLSLGGLAAAVSMMLLHVLLVFFLERFIVLLRSPAAWFVKTARIVMVILPAVGLIFFHISHVGPKQRFQTANILVDYGDATSMAAQQVIEKVKREVVKRDHTKKELAAVIADSPYVKLMLDFLSVKRTGFGNAALNGVGLILTLIFFAFIIYGVYIKSGSLLIIGLWGFVTSLQAGTGFLQFSSYQREGWSLLIAVCCMGGILADRILMLGYRIRYKMILVVFFMISLFGWSFLYPPRHPAMRSSAEDEVVRSTRFLGQSPSKISDTCSEPDDPLCEIFELLTEELPLTLVTRQFTGWDNQGEITPNVLQPESSLKILTYSKQELKGFFQPEEQYIVLIDKVNRLSGSQVVRAFAMVTPAMVEATLRQQNHLFVAGEKLLEYIQGLSEAEWTVQKVTLTKYLDAYVVKTI